MWWFIGDVAEFWIGWIWQNLRRPNFGETYTSLFPWNSNIWHLVQFFGVSSRSRLVASAVRIKHQSLALSSHLVHVLLEIRAHGRFGMATSGVHLPLKEGLHVLWVFNSVDKNLSGMFESRPYSSATDLVVGKNGGVVRLFSQFCVRHLTQPTLPVTSVPSGTAQESSSGRGTCRWI